MIPPPALKAKPRVARPISKKLTRAPRCSTPSAGWLHEPPRNQSKRRGIGQMQTPTLTKSIDLKNPVSPANARGHRRRAIRQLSRAKKTNKSSDETITMSTQSPKTSKATSQSSVGMFSAGEARCDRWQELAHAAQTLVAQSSSGASAKETLAKVEALLAPLGVIENFHAYPGETMMSGLKDALSRSDYSTFSRITNRIAKAIITGSYRRSVNAWKLGEEGE